MKQFIKSKEFIVIGIIGLVIVLLIAGFWSIRESGFRSMSQEIHSMLKEQIKACQGYYVGTVIQTGTTTPESVQFQCLVPQQPTLPTEPTVL